jgi:hypothetical protein
LPLKASEVDPTCPFSGDELLYRRLERHELNENGEVDPTRINSISFRADVESAPSVMRSRFSDPEDVLHVLCAERDTTGWRVYFIRVDALPVNLKSGDGRSFDFFPKHVPLIDCGAHSVVACAESGDAGKIFVRPSTKVINDFKVRFATALRPVQS